MAATLFDCYLAIEAASQQMLEAARSSSWDEVVRYEGACAVLIEQLRHLAREAELSPQQRREKTRIMQNILRNDAQVRLLAEPWVSEMDRLISPGLAQTLH